MSSGQHSNPRNTTTNNHSTPFQSASIYASNFLNNSFAPFSGPSGRREDAPLFFSTVDEGNEAAGSGMSLRESKYGRGLRSPSAEGEDDNDDHGGLGHHSGTLSDNGEEDDDAGPFRSEGRSSSSRPASRPDTPSSASSIAQTGNNAGLAGWRMHHTRLLPPIQQSVINDMYDQAESVFSSVFIGRDRDRVDKGKQRAAYDDEQISEKTTGEEEEVPEEPPEFLVAEQSKQDSYVLPTHNSKSGIIHLSESIQQQFSMSSPSSGKMHRYPMPTARYRRRATGPLEVDYQDQSPRDSFWLSLYLFNALFTIFLGLWQFLFDTSSHLPSNLPSSSIIISPSLAILESLPLLSGLILTSTSLIACTLAYLFLVQNGCRHIVHFLTFLPTAVLLLCSGWAFSASYSHFSSSSSSDDPSKRLEEVEHATSLTESFLRWTSAILLLGGGIAIRWAYLRSSSTRMERTIRVLEVSAEVLLAHPQIFLLAGCMLAAFLVLSVPCILLVSKLLIHGYATVISSSSPGSLIKARTYLVPSSWAMVGAIHTGFVFFWTTAIMRGVIRSTIAGTVAEWWFYRHQVSPLGRSRRNLQASQSMASSHARSTYSTTRAKKTVQKAFSRSIGPSLGTICISSLLLSIYTTFSLLLSAANSLISRLRRYSFSPIPSMLLRIVLNCVLLPLVAILAGLLKNLNDFALVYSGVTGDRFWDSAREAHQLIAGRNGTDIVVSHLMVKNLLSLAAFAFALVGALSGYLSAAYWSPNVDGENEIRTFTPLLVSFICAVIPYWCVRISGDVLINAVDATFVCFNIDLDMGVNNCSKAFEAFAYEDPEDESDGEMDVPGGYPEEV